MRVIAWPCFALLGSAVLLSAQAKPAPSAEVDQALRERASQFMQFTVDRTFSKAYAFVADDSKDWYLSSGKSQYTKFKIQTIDYADDLKQAVVKVQVTRVFSMQGHDIPSDIVVDYIWRLEDGKWMYYHDPDVFTLPFGGDVKIDRNLKSRGESVPKDTSPEAATRMASGLKPEVSTDKSEVNFVRGTAATDQIVIHNGIIGTVDVEADVVGDYGSFSVEPTQFTLASGKDVVVKISYKPVDREIESNLRVRVAPFGWSLTVPLRAVPPSSPTPAR